MLAGGTSPPPKDFAAPIGRPRLKRAPLVSVPPHPRKSLPNPRLPPRLRWNPKRHPSRLLRPRSLCSKKPYRRSNLPQSQKRYLLLLRPPPLQPLP
jgi:hypothetical protein